MKDMRNLKDLTIHEVKPVSDNYVTSQAFLSIYCEEFRKAGGETGLRRFPLQGHLAHKRMAHPYDQRRALGMVLPQIGAHYLGKQPRVQSLRASCMELQSQ